MCNLGSASSCSTFWVVSALMTWMILCFEGYEIPFWHRLLLIRAILGFRTM